VAGASASGVTVEREQDTWDGLISSPLSGWEILRGKAVGAIWGLRGFGGLLSLFWLVGLAAGAIHPLGLLLASIIAGLLTWFVLALGTYASLRARTTSRAVTGTIAMLVFLNIGYFGLLIPVLMMFDITHESRWPEMGWTPLLPSNSLPSYPQVANIVDAARTPGRHLDLDLRSVVCATIVLIGYAIAAALLTRRLVRRFDEVVDRLRRRQDVPDRTFISGGRSQADPSQ